jgi:molecular chaperone HscB
MEMEKVLTKRACWSCGSEVDHLYSCSRCGALQRLPDQIDYFTCLGLNYRLRIDPKALESKFYELSRKFHPDFYQNKSQEEQAISLENAAILNKAYRTLRDPVDRIEYLIGLAEGKNTLGTEVPSDLFDEIFELQEAMEAIREIPAGDAAQRAPVVASLETAKKKFQERQAQDQKELDALAERWDALEGSYGGSHGGSPVGQRPDRVFTDAQRACLREMKKVLSHRAYLDRILNDIGAAIGKGS